jgi:hypothetical protein
MANGGDVKIQFYTNFVPTGTHVDYDAMLNFAG